MRDRCDSTVEILYRESDDFKVELNQHVFLRHVVVINVEDKPHSSAYIYKIIQKCRQPVRDGEIMYAAKVFSVMMLVDWCIGIYCRMFGKPNFRNYIYKLDKSEQILKVILTPC